MNNQLTNGGIWNDSSGNPIHAHGGHMLFHDDYYYWYGEDRRDDIYVSCYRSKDLFNWEFRNHILTTSTPAAPIRVRTNLALVNDKGGKVNLERPKVLFNAVTKSLSSGLTMRMVTITAMPHAPLPHRILRIVISCIMAALIRTGICRVTARSFRTMTERLILFRLPETMRTCTSIVCRRIISMWKVLSESCGRGSIGRRQPSSNGKGSIIW